MVTSQSRKVGTSVVSSDSQSANHKGPASHGGNSPPEETHSRGNKERGALNIFAPLFWVV